jgi:tetratricopeptide (TPR) repeat protein
MSPGGAPGPAIAKPPNGNWRQGQQAQRAKRLAEAIQHYRRAAAVDGSYFEAHYSLGLAAFERGTSRPAAAAWETAIAIRPDSAMPDIILPSPSRRRAIRGRRRTNWKSCWHCTQMRHEDT